MKYSTRIPEGTSFPFTQKMIDNLTDGSLVSPVAITHPWVKVKPSEIPFDPIYPDNELFWDQLIDVVKAVASSRRNEVLPVHELSNTVRKRYNVHTSRELGKLVEADMPPDIVIELADYLLDNGCKFRNITNENPGIKNFTNGVVLLCRILAWSIHYVSPTAFAHKFHFGMPRPEELVYKVLTGEADAPQHVIKELRRLISPKWESEILADMTNFGVYPAPQIHFSFPAMHASAAAATLILPVFFDVNDDELSEIRKTMLNIAFGRTYGGVHYPQDNYYGLYLGEEVISRILPNKLAKFGANKAEVKKLIEKYRTNWLKYI